MATKKKKTRQKEKASHLVYLAFATGQIAILYEIYHSITKMSAPSWINILLSILATLLGIGYGISNGLKSVVRAGIADLVTALALLGTKVYIESHKPSTEPDKPSTEPNKPQEKYS